MSFDARSIAVKQERTRGMGDVTDTLSLLYIGKSRRVRLRCAKLSYLLCMPLSQAENTRNEGY